jgi:P-type Mg2+ transporter
VLGRQLHNPLLILLVVAAVTSFAVGEHASALIILLIISMSVGLGFFDEYRSELAVEALHSKLHHTGLVTRDGKFRTVDVTQLVSGDVVQLAVGDVVLADLRLLRADGLECDEAMLTGESLPAEKQSDPITTAPASSLALPVRVHGHRRARRKRAGRHRPHRCADGVRRDRPAARRTTAQTAFQLGLRDFSLMLVRVTAVLAGPTPGGATPCAAVPVGLVRGVAVDPEPRHLRHPHPPYPLLPQ